MSLPLTTVTRHVGTFAFTGHRPIKLGGYGEHIALRLFKLATSVLTELKPDEVISGMALGWDQAVAYAAIRLGIPTTAAVPFEGQESIWPDASKLRYYKILKKCTKVETISRGEFSGRKMQIRNQWMVDNSDALVALWDGSNGGTANCVLYAKSIGASVHNVWPQWVALSQCN